MTTTVEIVTFRLKDGISSEHFLAAAKPTFDLLQSFDGYIGRELTLSEDGTWIDIVHWRDMATALHAAEAVMTTPVGQGFATMIDEKTMVMHHTSPQLTSVSART